MEGIATFLSNHWRLLLEMLLISGGVYFAWRRVRSISGARMLIETIIVLLALTMIFNALEMTLIRTILGLFVIALVVVFQPELRHAFVTLIGDRLFTAPQNSAELIEQMEETVRKLSGERGMDLKQIAETGVEVDAKYSPSLVYTIFHPLTTLHDGGVILSDGRIQAAGCVFPVSQRELLDRSIGLRHRAAMGITEQTDAIAVVVSEETGQISIAHGGKLDQSLTPELFSKRLTELLSRKVKNIERPMMETAATTATSLQERTATKRLGA
jgi:diadenylate cyclase